MNQPSPIINFGIHKDKQLSDLSIPCTYIFWLASRGSYQEPGNRFKNTWAVPITLSILARREAENRGFKNDGDKWRKE